MSTNSSIEWTEATWNPVVGCTRVSAGCDNCYAVGMTNRLDGMSRGGPNPGKGRTAQYRGLTVLNKRGERHFNGIVRTVPEALDLPLGWKQPKRIFVNSMSDLFHRDVPFEFIDQVFAVMALCPQHTFQVLTKRPDRMAEYLTRPVLPDEGWPVGSGAVLSISGVLECWQQGSAEWLNRLKVWSVEEGLIPARHLPSPIRLPLPNVWLGTSCENQGAADERIPHLLRCPAAVRFASCEPLLDGIDFSKVPGFNVPGSAGREMLRNFWCIVGGESGPHARPCRIEWIRSIVDQFRYAGMSCFVKQLGSNPIFDKWDEMYERQITDPKGGDMAEWPKDLRVRGFPEGGAD